jgi:hypothetical protein
MDNFEYHSEQIAQILLEKMFEFAGIVPLNKNLRKTKDVWYGKYNWTLLQRSLWIEWGVNFLQSKFNLPPQRAKFEMEKLDLQYGLKINKI